MIIEIAAIFLGPEEKQYHRIAINNLFKAEYYQIDTQWGSKKMVYWKDSLEFVFVRLPDMMSPQPASKHHWHDNRSLAAFAHAPGEHVCSRRLYSAPARRKRELVEDGGKLSRCPFGQNFGEEKRVQPLDQALKLAVCRFWRTAHNNI